MLSETTPTPTPTATPTFGAQQRQIAVVKVAACNAETTAGCGQPPAVITAGQNMGEDAVIAVSAKTDTIYIPLASADTVAIVNGATCNGFETAGCTGNIAAVGIGRSARLVAIDLLTDVIYVTDYSSAGVSVLNESTCNATSPPGAVLQRPSKRSVRSPMS